MELGPYLRRCLLGGLGLAAIFEIGRASCRERV